MEDLEDLCTSQFQNRPSPHPRANPQAFDFLKNSGQIPRYVGSMPHWLELQRAIKSPTLQVRSGQVRYIEATIKKFSHVSNRLFKCKYSTITVGTVGYGLD